MTATFRTATGYTHNTIARSLVSGSTRTVGLAISAITNFYFANILSAIETQVSKAGYTLLLADTHDDPDKELQVVEALHQRRADEVLLAAASGPRGPALRYLQELGVPTVLRAVTWCFAAGSSPRLGPSQGVAVAALPVNAVLARLACGAGSI